MSDALNILLPLYVFMTCPLWVTMLMIGLGAILDRIRPRRATPTEIAVNAAKARSIAARRTVEGLGNRSRTSPVPPAYVETRQAA